MLVTLDMKPTNLLLALPLLCITLFTQAQQTNYTAGVNSGLFRYNNTQAFYLTGVVDGPLLRSNLNESNATKPGFSFEITGNIQRITRSRFLFGAELAYQSYRTKTPVSFFSPSLFASALIPADGNTTMQAQFITVTPFAGYRLLDKKLKLDLTAGMELAAAIQKKEVIKAREIYNGNLLEASNDQPRRADYRARIQLNASMDRIGLTTGYALGLANYYSSDEFLVSRARFVRFGLTYRIH
jgi:hypothetical protein